MLSQEVRIYNIMSSREKASSGQNQRWLKQVTKKGFDRYCYRSLNPDLRDVDSNLTLHYLRYGRSEARRANVAVRGWVGDQIALDMLPSVIVWSETSDRESTELLLQATNDLVGQVNLFFVFDQEPKNLRHLLAKSSGVVVCQGTYGDVFVCEALISKISRVLKPKAAIVFGGSFIGRFLKLAGIPTVSVVMDHPSDIAPGLLAEVVTWSECVLTTAEWDETDCDAIRLPLVSSPVVARTPLPSLGSRSTTASPDRLRGSGLHLLAGGELDFFGGIDVFFEAVETVREKYPELPVQATWLAPGETGPEDQHYLERLTRCGARSQGPNAIKIETDRGSIHRALQSADLYLSTSRREKVSYFAELAVSKGVRVIGPSSESVGVLSVSKYVASLSTYVDALLAGGELESRKKVPIRGAAKETFSDRLGKALKTAIEHHEKDVTAVDRILASGFLDLRYSLGVLAHNSSLKDAAWEYYQRSLRKIPNHRPTPGFNPVVYRDSQQLGSREEPFLHYVEQGRPQGVWESKVLTLEPGREGDLNRHFVIHIHAYYRDLLEEVLESLRWLPPGADLVVSAVGEVSEREAKRVLASRGLSRARVFLGENRGRNFGTLFEAARRFNWDEKTLVCHLHTKRSPHLKLDSGMEHDFVANWRRFLWGNLIGSGKADIIPQIVNRFVEDSTLGLVFPYDPILMSVGVNGQAMSLLAEKLKINEREFLADFPVGGMFWARGDVLSFMANRLDYDDFPEEPIEPDGTIVHATERIFPWVCLEMGYSYNVTYTEGLRR